jgi:hypothetical protein
MKRNVFRKRRAEPFLRMTGALQRSSLEKFGSSQLIRRGSVRIVSSGTVARRIFLAENAGLSGKLIL